MEVLHSMAVLVAQGPMPTCSLLLGSLGDGLDGYQEKEKALC